MKEKTKEMKITFNDFVMTAISVTMKKYLNQRGDLKSKEMIVMAPYNFREKPEHPKTFKFCNQFCIFPYKLSLVDDFETGWRQIHKNLESIRNSFITIGMYYMAELILSLPLWLASLFIGMLGRKPSIIVSNVAASPVPWVIGGFKSKSATTFIPSLG